MKKILILLALACTLLCSCGKESAPVAVQTEGNDPTEQTEETQKPLKREEPGHKKTVIVDPGHGFGDVGCGGPQSKIGCYEHTLTVDMARSLKNSLESRGYIVYLTHDGKTFPSLSEIRSLADKCGVEYDETKDKWTDDNVFSPYERVIYMNCLDAMYGVDFSISVHVNANAESEKLNGFDLDYCKENDWSSESFEIVKKIRSMIYNEYPGRELYLYADSWEDAFVVTKFNSMPSALFETGYSTNDADAALLTDAAWRKTLMDNLAEAVAGGLGE